MFDSVSIDSERVLKLLFEDMRLAALSDETPSAKKVTAQLLLSYFSKIFQNSILMTKTSIDLSSKEDLPEFVEALRQIVCGAGTLPNVMAGVGVKGFFGEVQASDAEVEHELNCWIDSLFENHKQLAVLVEMMKARLAVKEHLNACGDSPDDIPAVLCYVSNTEQMPSPLNGKLVLITAFEGNFFISSNVQSQKTGYRYATPVDFIHFSIKQPKETDTPAQ